MTRAISIADRAAGLVYAFALTTGPLLVIALLAAVMMASADLG